ncbi:MAG TPA: HNH endonuclease signature motif containing protein, partial [Mycobacterium sp.]|nr:HNH endonuclease signature motif containing protein [Mycobacterium sp.]
RAAGARLVAISELDLVRLRQYGEQATWCSGTEAAITVEIAAALQISRNWAESYLYYARAMRLRLPRVGALLCAGDISYGTFRTIVYRTDLITDPQILAAVDASLAGRAARWPTMTRSRLAGYVDKVVARADADAVRQRRERHQDREITIWGDVDGVTEIGGRLFTTDAYAVDARLDALAGTVCDEDPRTRAQRRADALGALAAGADRLACRCGRAECPAGDSPTPSPVLIYVVAEQATLDGTGSTPGSLIGADALIPAELLAELADNALRRSLIHPGDTAPEPGYLPSSRLADFVRCRDLTCRFPGCDEPALQCDLDHTIAHADGGATHASNLKALCRRHHLIKTFWGWQDKQLPDGTLIWTAPTGHTYVTTPGSALLFPALCTPTGQLAPPDPERVQPCTDRTAAMPKRRHTRAQNHARYITAERRKNRQARETRKAARQTAGLGPAPPADPNDDPPPF